MKIRRVQVRCATSCSFVVGVGRAAEMDISDARSGGAEVRIGVATHASTVATRGAPSSGASRHLSRGEKGNKEHCRDAKCLRASLQREQLCFRSGAFWLPGCTGFSFSPRESNCVPCQAIFGSFSRHGSPSRSMALRMVSSFRMQATRATLPCLPAARNRS